MPDLIVGQNSYLTLAEADSYLSGSIRAASLWAALTDEDKILALISAHRALELESWEGERSEVFQAASFAITSGGAGYSLDDVVTCVLGAGAGTVAQVKVASVAAGVVDGIVLLHTGFYTTKSADPIDTTVVPAGGAGLTLTPVYESEQQMDWPRIITCAPDDVVSDDVPTDIKTGQAELAFDFSQNPSLEVGAGTQGTSSNTKKVKAGSASVEFFKPTRGVPYPSAVWQRISIYRDGACGGAGNTGSAAFGTDGESAFADRDEYDLNRGYS